MFCPQCGQQQVSKETRFCSRCGLPLNLIAEVVAHGGTLPVLEQIDQKRSFYNKSTGVKFGLIWFLTVTFLLVPLFAVLDWDNIVPMTAILGFVGGILIMVFSAIFLESKSKTSYSNPNQFPANLPNFLSGNQQSNALPPPQSVPVEHYVQPPANSWREDTNDLHRTSVTEETTKLLNEQELKK